jgi:hypothetical protein
VQSEASVDQGCREGYSGRPCGKRTCSHCHVNVARDWLRVLTVNVGTYGGTVALATITAPGESVLPRDSAGRCLPQQLREWSLDLPVRWTRLHQAAQQATERECGRRANVLVRVWELQPKRGAPHAHPVIGTNTPAELAAAQRYVIHLRRLARAHGFGRVHSWRRMRQENLTEMSGSRAAVYLSSYLVSGEGGKLSVRESFASPYLPTRVLWVTPRLTAQTGVTRRNLRRVRHVWVWLNRQNGHTNFAPRWFRRDAEYHSYRLCVATLAAGRAPPQTS